MIRRTGWLLFFAFCGQPAAAQYALHLLANPPANTKELYVTGSFNNWNPRDENYRLTAAANGQFEIVLKALVAGEYKYKFTRGSATTLECAAAGTNIRPRVIRLQHDTMVNAVIAAWSDGYFSLSNLPDSLLNEAAMARAGYYVEINLDSSYKYAVQLYQLSKRLHMPMKEARALDLQAVIFTRQGNGEKALSLLLRSLALKKQLNDSSGGTSFTYSSIGKINEGVGDTGNALENYRNAGLWLNKQNEIYKASSLTDIGNLVLKSNKTDSAAWYAQQALHFNPQYFGALLLMGDIAGRNQHYGEALVNYAAACAASERGTPGTAQYYNAVEAYERMAGVFEQEQQQDSAYFYARKAFALAVGVNNPAAIAGASSVLVNLFKKDKKYDSGFFYQQLLLQKKDSLFTAEKDRQVHNIYFTEKLRQQDALAASEKRRAQLKIYLLLGLVGLLVAAAIGYRALLKSRLHKQLAETEMRALRAQMNPHFIFNCLASINRYIVKSDTHTASAYLTKFSKLIRLMLDNSANELVSIDTELQTLKLYMDMELLRFDNAFRYEIQGEQVTGNDCTGIPSMIIQPYVENAIWHGLLQRTSLPPAEDEKGKLWLRFLPHGEGVLKIEIEDNGIGRVKAAELRKNDLVKTRSYGMQISRDRIALINQQYHMQSSVTIIDLLNAEGRAAGTKVIVYLPLIEMAAQAQKENI